MPAAQDATRRKADMKNWPRYLRATRRQAEIVPEDAWLRARDFG